MHPCRLQVTICKLRHMLSMIPAGSKLPTINKTLNHSTPVRGPADHEVRDQIVAVATEHFSLYGYEKTTVSDFAKGLYLQIFSVQAGDWRNDLRQLPKPNRG